MGRSRSLADKLNHLFATVIPAGRGAYTNDEVADATGLSKSAVQYLRNGERTNPTMQTIEKLATFFAVPPSYFFDTADAIRIEEQLDAMVLLAALGRENVRRVAARLHRLSDPDLFILDQFVDRFLQAGGEPGAGP